jgi:hypothetical protein
MELGDRQRSREKARMNNVVELEKTDIVQQRPFTNPGHTSRERALMCQMVDRLRSVVAPPDLHVDAPNPLVLLEQEPDGRPHRVVVTAPERLADLVPLTVVGFFGQKRSEVDLTALDAADEMLIADFPRHPDVLSYSSLELGDGDCGNLVLLARPEAKSQWSHWEAHARAVREIAPQVYRSVRLYNGELPNGIAASDALRLTCVKYYDYRCSPFWRGVRWI